MRVKINKAPKGIGALPAAETPVSSGVTAMGAPQVTIHVTCIDAFGISSVLCGVYLSVSEARSLANRLNAQALDAETLAENELRTFRAKLAIAKDTP